MLVLNDAPQVRHHEGEVEPLSMNGQALDVDQDAVDVPTPSNADAVGAAVDAGEILDLALGEAETRGRLIA